MCVTHPREKKSASALRFLCRSSHDFVFTTILTGAIDRSRLPSRKEQAAINHSARAHAIKDEGVCDALGQFTKPDLWRVVLEPRNSRRCFILSSAHNLRRSRLSSFVLQSPKWRVH
jgi:hypothetical protein